MTVPEAAVDAALEAFAEMWPGIVEHAPKSSRDVMQRALAAGYARVRLEATAVMLGGYGSENIDQFLSGDFRCASPEDVEYLQAALAA